MRKLTELEQKCIDKTVELWNALAELEVLNDHDQTEMMSKIHDIQSRVMSRPYRDNRSDKPVKKKVNYYAVNDKTKTFNFFNEGMIVSEIVDYLEGYPLISFDKGVHVLYKETRDEHFDCGEYIFEIHWLSKVGQENIDLFNEMTKQSIFLLEFKHHFPS